MSKVRYTENSFVNAKLMATERREQIELQQSWLGSFDKEFWKGVVLRINARLEALQLERDTQMDKMNDSALRSNLACDKELRFFLSLPERSRQSLETMKQGYQEIVEFMNANRDKTD